MGHEKLQNSQKFGTRSNYEKTKQKCMKFRSVGNGRP